MGTDHSGQSELGAWSMPLDPTHSVREETYIRTHTRPFRAMMVAAITAAHANDVNNITFFFHTPFASSSHREKSER